MSSTGNLLSIPRFPESCQLAGESTWRPFKDQVESHIEVRQLDGYLDGTIPQPPPNGYVSTSTIYPPTSVSTTTPMHSPTPYPEEWRQRDRLAASIIYLNIVDPVGLGIERSKKASVIWDTLKKKFERRDEQRVHMADTKLRKHRFDPDTTSMEEHERTMKNLVKDVRDLGGSCLDSQFRLIVIASMPKSWKELTINIRGNSSDDAFVHLRQIYDMKKDDEQDVRNRNQFRALIAQEMATYQSANAVTVHRRERCTNPNCPPRRRTTHTLENCWAPGGGDEGGVRTGRGPARKKGTDQHVAQAAEQPVAQIAQVSESLSIMDLFEMCTSQSLTSPSPAPNARTRRTVVPLTEGYGGTEGETEYIDIPRFLPSCNAVTSKNPTPLLYGTPVPPSARTFLDSAASDHFWVRRSDFVSYENLYGRAGSSAVAGKAGEFEIHGRGVVEFVTKVDGVNRRVRLSNVLHTPSFHHNLISLRTLDSQGMNGEWGKGSLSVRSPDGRTVMRGEGRGTLYEVKVEFPAIEALSARSHNKPVDIQVWHRRLGHVSIQRILQMERLKLVDGLDITSKKLKGRCEPCIYGKATRRPFDEKLTHETRGLERVHLDLWGAARTQSRGGAVWMLLITDGRSTVKAPSFLANKRAETTLGAVHDWRVKAENQTGETVKVFRIDGGGEFDNDEMDAYAAKYGIEIERIPPRSSASNGMAERANRTVIEGVRTFLEDSGFPPSMWAEAALTFCYVSSFVPSARFPDEIPIEVYTKKRQDVAHLRPFGCRCWATLADVQTDGKLSRQAVEGRLLGYMGRRGYKVWIPDERKIYESRDVVFEEGDPRRTVPAVPDEVDGAVFADVDVEPNVNGDQNPPLPDLETQPTNSSTPSQVSPASSTSLLAPDPLTAGDLPIVNTPPADIVPRRSTRNRNPSARQLDSSEFLAREDSARTLDLAWANDRPLNIAGIDAMEGNAMAMIVQSPFAFASDASDKWVPSSYKQAMKRPDLWMAPMRAEYETLMEKKCWTLVDLPPDANLTGGRWVYAIKWTKDGQVAKRKARWVAQGFTQVQGVDYDKTYGAVARMESVRIVLAIIAILGLYIFQVDFKAVFLNSPISHDVYMKQPDGFVQEGEEDKVCKLGVSIYGTMQGSHDWQDTLGKGYKEDGYVASRADPCVRYRRDENGYTLTTTYGDDVNGASETVEGKEKAIRDLGKRWESSVVDSGVLLGMTIVQDPVSKAITISQKSYFERMLEHFGLQHVRHRNTPLPPKINLSESSDPLPDADRIFMRDKPYRSFVGSVLWGQVCTRPDLAFASGYLARFQMNPGRFHWEACEWLAGYILRTIDYSITYRAPSPGDTRRGSGLAPAAYSDSDWATCVDTRRSTAGHVFFMGGSPVCWESKRQSSVALSTVQAEYMALSRACQQACWLRSFLTEIDLPIVGPTEILGDNSGSVSLTEDSKRHALVKHIDMRYHFIRERVAEGVVKIVRIDSASNVADVMTKPLDGSTHGRMVDMLRLDCSK